MRSHTLRLWLIGALALAAVVSVIGNKADSPWIGWLELRGLPRRRSSSTSAGAAPALRERRE